MSKTKKYTVVDNSDVRCICGHIAEARIHTSITEKQLSQPLYFSKWFNCKNSSCKRTIFMIEEFKVINSGIRQPVTPISQMIELDAQQTFWSKNL